MSNLRPLISAAPIALLIIITLVACAGDEGCETLPYRTIARHGGESGWTSLAPELIIVADPSDPYADEPLTDSPNGPGVLLAELDYQFVIVALLGARTQLYDEFQIARVVRRGNRVLVYGITDPPRKGREMTPSSPYHMIEVTKHGRWGRQFRFELYLNGELVVERDHYVPEANLPRWMTPEAP